MTLGVKGREKDFCEEYLTRVRFNGDCYEVSLPFKKEHPIIPNNHSLARNHLVSLLKILNFSVSKDQNPKVLQEAYKLVKHKVHILGLQEYSL